jgi:hypothetical protein
LRAATAEASDEKYEASVLYVQQPEAPSVT